MDTQTKTATAAFCAKLLPLFDVQQAILFGSRARNAHHSESDADVAVILRGAKGHFMNTRFAMADLAYEVMLDTGIRIQPLPIWAYEWEHPEQYPNPNLLFNIRAEGLVL